MCAMQEVVRRQLNRTKTGSGSAGPTGHFSQLCLRHATADVLRATEPSTTAERRVRQSLHPHVSRAAVTDFVSVPGTRALWVTFDPRCCLPRGAELVFLGEDERTVIARFRGGEMSSGARVPAWRPLVIHGSKVRYRFICRCEAEEVCWGYRFHVQRVEGLHWRGEAEAADKGSLEFGCWLLELILRDAPRVVESGEVHSSQTFNGLVGYLRARGAPYKHRIVALLTRLLRSPALRNAPEPVQTRALSSLEGPVMQRCMALDRKSVV